MDPTPQYVLVAAPLGGSRVQLFGDPGPEGVGRLLERPPTFRWAGFDMRTLDTAHLLKEDVLEVRTGDRKIIHLHANGLILARLAADSRFLGWGTDAGTFEAHPRLNAVACVEAHAAFVHLYRNVLPRLLDKPRFVRMHQALRNAIVNGENLYITRFDQYPTQVEPKHFPAHSVIADADHTFPTEELRDHPNRVAGKLIEGFAEFFEIPIRELPFLKKGTSGVEFDEEDFRRGG